MKLQQAVRSVLHRFDLDIVRHSSNQTALESDLRQKRLLALLNVLPKEALGAALSAVGEAKSQLGQDVLALAMNGFKRGGFFVEFGATDGLTLSNTWLLEHKFGWTGILAEPARIWHADLAKNRHVSIEHGCVWSETGQTVEFSEVPSEAELSTITRFEGEDSHRGSRTAARRYTVETISFNDLLEKYQAPASPDFLSIDTEGSELAILQSLDWDRWRPKLITCEHNYTANREQIHGLLTGVGYRRIFETVSDFDDWYLLGDA